MNYVILNGVKSSTIKGLLIQSLPPISKPLMRTSIEQIDGRDGDIVTKLGYSAYDKEIEIGLFGKFDVDDVIQYFDSEGTVTFSNEPDKYYNYQIIKEIDFERLIRFRTAKVTFHVQPFKYSAVDSSISLSNQLFKCNNWTQTKNGITLSVTDGVISVSGTATGATEFYLPLNGVNLDAGSYTLFAKASGSGANLASIRLIGSVPSNADSFGGNYLALQNDATASLSATLTASKSYGYLWFYINAGSTDFTLNVAIENNNLKSMTVINRGNTMSRPQITIHGNGTINLSLNGVQIFVINLEDMGYITIDSAQMNAYQGELLMNRYVVGDYEDLTLNVGSNEISWTGDITGLEVSNYTRWL